VQFNNILKMCVLVIFRVKKNNIEDKFRGLEGLEGSVNRQNFRIFILKK